MKPPMGISATGVKTKTGLGSDPVTALPRVMDADVTTLPIAGAAFCTVPASPAVDRAKYPAPRAVPRDRPVSVIVTAEVPVATTEMVMTKEAVSATAALVVVPVIVATEHLVAAKVPVPVK